MSFRVYNPDPNNPRKWRVETDKGSIEVEADYLTDTEAKLLAGLIEVKDTILRELTENYEIEIEIDPKTFKGKGVFKRRVVSK